MLEPDQIAEIVCGRELVAQGERALAGKRVLITAGPTREPIDPVRYITNRSSGKMGYALAAAAAREGAEVVLVSGPVNLEAPGGVRTLPVETAEQMFDATHDNIGDIDIFIAAAAVSDYRPAGMAEQKIKKKRAEMRLDLVRSPDILASVAALDDAPFTVGFAAETERVREYALSKLENKKLDMIVANRVGTDRGFDRDDNAVSVYWHDGKQEFPVTAKIELAGRLIKLIASRYEATRGVSTQPELTVVSIKD